MEAHRGIPPSRRDADLGHAVPGEIRRLRAGAVPARGRTKRVGSETGRGPPRGAQAVDGPEPPRPPLLPPRPRRGGPPVCAIPEGPRDPPSGPARGRVLPRRPARAP